MTKRAVWVLVGVGVALVAGIAVVAILGWLTLGATWPLDKPNEVSAFATYWYSVFTLLTLLVLIGAAVVALRQARIAAKSRDAEVFLYILERYIENPHLFGVRGFINRHMQEINITVQGPQPTRQNRDIIDQQVRKLSDGKFTLEDIYHVMSSMQNICLLIGHRFMSERLTLEFYAIIRRMWDLLEPMVKFEQERRKADKEYAPWFCDDFERVAIEMRDPGYLARFGIKQSG